MEGQYHFTLEPQTTVCVPLEDGYKVYSSTQWMDLAQAAMSKAINVPQHKIQFEVRRVGGGYGSKAFRSSLIGCTSVLVAHLLNRPARFVQTIEAMMETLGKRFPYFTSYSATFTATGKISALTANILIDRLAVFSNTYSGGINWKPNMKVVVTDAASSTIMRGPGTFQCIAIVENIIEHIAFKLGLDSADVRLQNIDSGNPMSRLYPSFLKKCDYRNRVEKVKEFNKLNRWRKKGIATSIMEFDAQPVGAFQATVNIYHGDGTVAISHGATEMGQGLNTKVIQVAAFTLGIPMEYIKIEPSNSLNGANSTLTANSVGSENVSFAVRKCCQTLVGRLDPIKRKLKPDATWIQIIEEAHKQFVTLIASETFKPTEMLLYKLYACSCSEVEYDALTGNTTILRVDIIEDTGESLSPLIDVGQIEGAFVTGLGYWFTESLKYDRRTGRIEQIELGTTKFLEQKIYLVELVQLRENNGGFLRSKTTGEPAICLAVSAYFATRKAIEALREDIGLPRKFLNIGPPASPENNLLVSEISPKDFKLK
uniref:Uncharacterized protein n=1 Tax=Megaselia scalaris TaxID=36166 RepID=T1GSG4_MEGSC